MAVELNDIELSNKYKKFMATFPNITLSDTDLAKTYIDLYKNLNRLEDYSRTFHTRPVKGHYDNCVWSYPDTEDGPDTCMCVIIGFLSYKIHCDLNKLFPEEEEQEEN